MSGIAGVDVNADVSAVRVCPYWGVPVRVIVPLSIASSVEKVAVGLAGDG